MTRLKSPVMSVRTRCLGILAAAAVALNCAASLLAQPGLAMKMFRTTIMVASRRVGVPRVAIPDRGQRLSENVSPGWRGATGAAGATHASPLRPRSEAHPAEL